MSDSDMIAVAQTVCDTLKSRGYTVGTAASAIFSKGLTTGRITDAQVLGIVPVSVAYMCPAYWPQVQIWVSNMASSS